MVSPEALLPGGRGRSASPLIGICDASLGVRDYACAVPQRIDASRAAFLFSAGSGERVPSLIVAVGRDVATMPVVERDIEQPVEDWVLMARVTLCVLDGPGDDAFLIGPLPEAQFDRHASWCETVDRRGSASVALLSDTALPRGITAGHLSALHGARGGTVRAVPPG